ncbi:stromal membrane-associated protein [Ascosphaera apis ARSEF 7405]|uniref:Stromal membrane-associated protein n=1 Tax=Ascosphaera apis ARSEF 7405 TaxID=392613 RepID=A0A167VD79_9EURO|nr:stromal membrane-associated protein [Ascosphaera apis ARSEF 7405]
MYRRSNNAAAERAAAQNQATVKSLLKLEGNKVCADCKRNKHPRWASWNIGVFICIRCSGHHRGMGTHISRVKSVDLDSWTDEQMKSMVKWGNTRANKYWEAKLAPGHVPSEAKIENFIRTKYEAKRWVLPGPIPDPSTLDDHEEDKPDENIVSAINRFPKLSVSILASPLIDAILTIQPLAIVQEQIKSQQAAAAAAGGPAASASAPVKPVTTRPARQLSLVDDDDIPATLSSAPPSRPSTTQPQPTAATSAANHPQAHSRVTSSASTPAARARPSDSIFGLDLFGPQVGSATSSVSGVAGAHGGARTATGSPAPGAQSRPDLKQSILSLYATPQPQPMVSPSQQQQQQASPGYGGAQGQQQSLFDSLTSPRMQTQQAVPVQQQKPKDAFILHLPNLRLRNNSNSTSTSKGDISPLRSHPRT